VRKGTPLALIVVLWGLTIASAAVLVLHGLSVDSPSLRVGVPALPPVHAVPVTGPRPGSHPGTSQTPALALGPGGGTTANPGGVQPPGPGSGGQTAFEATTVGSLTAAGRLACQATVATPRVLRAFCGHINSNGKGSGTAGRAAKKHAKHENHGRHTGAKNRGKHQNRRGDHHEGDDRQHGNRGRHEHDGGHGHGGDRGHGRHEGDHGHGHGNGHGHDGGEKKHHKHGR